MGTYREGEVRSTITSTIGGVMTEEVGAVTGELEVATRTGAEGIEVAVRYAGADEWYTVEGSPIEPGSTSGSFSSELDELHERVVRHLKILGPTTDGNEEAASLQSFSLRANDS